MMALVGDRTRTRPSRPRRRRGVSRIELTVARGSAIRRLSQRTWVLCIVWLLSAAYLFQSRRAVFYPLDEGLLAESAARVLGGELPHRDFVEVYTGGLSAIDAVAFRVWGANLLALRDLLCLAAVLWVPVLYAIATRVASPVSAGLAVLAAVAWSVPYYPLGMPSWYVLFLTSAGTLAILQFIERGDRRWLIAAGLAAGAACAIKITGLYFIAAALLIFVYLEQTMTETDGAGSSAYTCLIVAGGCAYLAAVTLLVRSQGIDALVTYALPNAAAIGLLMWREYAGPHADARRRIAVYAGLLGPFLVGVAVPLAVLLAPYVRAGAVGALVTGVFVTPMKRIAVMYAPPFPVATTLAAIPVAAALGLFSRSTRVRWTVAILAIIALIASGVIAPYTDPLAVMSRLVRDGLRGLVPVVAVAGAAVIAGRRGSPALAVLLFVLATGWLIMFPFAHDVYFHYAAPLLVLTVLALARPGRASAFVGALVLAYAVAQHTLGIAVPAWHMVPLNIARGGPLVAPRTNAMYERLVSVVHAHARGGYIYATPDSPDVYFLTGYANPTPTLYEAFDPPGDRARAIPPLLDARGVTVAVIARQRYVSGPIAADLAAALDRQFPQADTVGWYVVRWR
jgi:hypothetical protein